MHGYLWMKPPSLPHFLHFPSHFLNCSFLLYNLDQQDDCLWTGKDMEENGCAYFEVLS
jgi:hypothetical protein